MPRFAANLSMLYPELPFLERFGALDCQELTGHDLGSPEGLKAYRQAGLKLKICTPINPLISRIM